MKLWKIFIVATTAMILPLALVSVGYAQELNCWGLRPTRTDEERPSENSFLGPLREREETEQWVEDSSCHLDDEPETEDSPDE